MGGYIWETCASIGVFVSARVPQHRALDTQCSDVQLRAPPMTALGVILHHQKMLAPSIRRRSSCRRTWILVSVFRRNHWGMGLWSRHGWAGCRRKELLLTDSG